MFNDTAVFLFSPAHRRCPRSSAKYVAVDASSPHKRAKKHRFPRLQTGAGCPLHAIDISECTFFALLIYQFASPHPGHFNVLFCHNVCNISMFRNRMFTKFDVPPMIHPSFLCKMAKYTCCTVFRAKFIHFSKGINSRVKTRAIFVRFLFRYLQFASFFLVVVLLS